MPLSSAQTEALVMIRRYQDNDLLARWHTLRHDQGIAENTLGSLVDRGLITATDGVIVLTAAGEIKAHEAWLAWRMTRHNI